MKKPASLSSGDSQVLSHILDSESAPIAGMVIGSNLPADQHINDPALLSLLKAKELEAIKDVESLSTEGLRDEATKHSIFVKSFYIFSHLIEEYPQYASAYNNRAQLIRWRYGDQVLVKESRCTTSDPSSTMLEMALSDLDSAISLATPRALAGPVSASQAKLLAQAHTQRGTLLYTASNDLNERESEKQIKISNIPSYKNFTLEMLEEASARDFFLGGRYGNEIGKAMAVHTNPYAKMCGNMLKEAMRKEFSPGLQLDV